MIMRKIVLLSLCGVLLLVLLCPFHASAEEYPITLSVSVKNDGSVQVTYNVEDQTKVCCWAACIYKKGDVIDLSLPELERTDDIVAFDPDVDRTGMIYPRSGEDYTRSYYQEMESWRRFRLDALTDGPNSPLKPGEYFVVAISHEEGDPVDRFLSEPVAFEMGDWERSLKVEQEENGSFAFETKGFFGGCCSVRVYLQGKECDPTTNKGSVLSWPIDFTLESRKTYPEGCGKDVGYHDLSALKGGIPTRPLKSGNYYAIVVDEEKDQVLTDPVAFEVSGEEEPSPAPSSAATLTKAPITEPSAEPADQENGTNGNLILYLCIGAAVLVIVLVVIVFAVKRKRK